MTNRADGLQTISDRFVQEVQDYVNSLLGNVRNALDAVSGNGHEAAPKATRTVAPKASATKARRTATAVEITPAKVIKVIAANPGLRSEELAEKLGVDSKSVKVALTSLRANGSVTTSGQSRGTTYKVAKRKRSSL